MCICTHTKILLWYFGLYVTTAEGFESPLPPSGMPFACEKKAQQLPYQLVWKVLADGRHTKENPRPLWDRGQWMLLTRN